MKSILRKTKQKLVNIRYKRDQHAPTIEQSDDNPHSAFNIIAVETPQKPHPDGLVRDEIEENLERARRKKERIRLLVEDFRTTHYEQLYPSLRKEAKSQLIKKNTERPKQTRKKHQGPLPTVDYPPAYSTNSSKKRSYREEGKNEFLQMEKDSQSVNGKDLERTETQSKRQRHHSPVTYHEDASADFIRKRDNEHLSTRHWLRARLYTLSYEITHPSTPNEGDPRTSYVDKTTVELLHPRPVTLIQENISFLENTAAIMCQKKQEPKPAQLSKRRYVRYRTSPTPPPSNTTQSNHHQIRDPPSLAETLSPHPPTPLRVTLNSPILHALSSPLDEPCPQGSLPDVVYWYDNRIRLMKQDIQYAEQTIIMVEQGWVHPSEVQAGEHVFHFGELESWEDIMIARGVLRGWEMEVWGMRERIGWGLSW